LNLSARLLNVTKQQRLVIELWQFASDLEKYYFGNTLSAVCTKISANQTVPALHYPSQF